MRAFGHFARGGELAFDSAAGDVVGQRGKIAFVFRGLVIQVRNQRGKQQGFRALPNSSTA